MIISLWSTLCQILSEKRETTPSADDGWGGIDLSQVPSASSVTQRHFIFLLKGILAVSYILIVVLITQAHAFVKTHYLYTDNGYILSCVSYVNKMIFLKCIFWAASKVCGLLKKSQVSKRAIDVTSIRSVPSCTNR